MPKFLLILVLAEEPELEAQLGVLWVSLQRSLAVLTSTVFPRRLLAWALHILRVFVAALVGIRGAISRRHHHLDTLHR